jgi:hypothetical protein
LTHFFCKRREGIGEIFNQMKKILSLELGARTDDVKIDEILAASGDAV